MTDHHEFLRAILDDPDNDAPRLVYADWLEENGREVSCPPCYGGGVAIHMTDLGPNRPMPPCSRCHGTGRISDGRAERAEFIRVQCKIAFLESKGGGQHRGDNYTHCPACGDLAALRRRERELLTEYRDAEGWSYYTRWAPEIFRRLPGCGWSFRRGFVASVTCAAADWHQHGKAVLAAQPVRRVRLTGLREPNFGDHVDCEVIDAQLCINRAGNLFVMALANGRLAMYTSAVISGPITPSPAP